MKISRKILISFVKKQKFCDFLRSFDIFQNNFLKIRVSEQFLNNFWTIFDDFDNFSWQLLQFLTNILKQVFCLKNFLPKYDVKTNNNFDISCSSWHFTRWLTHVLLCVVITCSTFNPKLTRESPFSAQDRVLFASKQ